MATNSAGITPHMLRSMNLDPEQLSPQERWRQDTRNSALRNLRKQYERETGKSASLSACIEHLEDYIEWLEHYAAEQAMIVCEQGWQLNPDRMGR